MDWRCASLLNGIRELSSHNCERINQLDVEVDILQQSQTQINEVYGRVSGSVNGSPGPDDTVIFNTVNETTGITWDAATNLFTTLTDGIYTVSYSVPHGTDAGPAVSYTHIGINGIGSAGERFGRQSLQNPSLDNYSNAGTASIRLSAGDTIGIYIESGIGTIVNPFGNGGSFTVHSLQIS